MSISSKTTPFSFELFSLACWTHWRAFKLRPFHGMTGFSRLPTLYWLPKLHKRPYKSRFIANSSACTTTELSILLTSCLTAIKKTCH